MSLRPLSRSRHQILSTAGKSLAGTTLMAMSALVANATPPNVTNTRTNGASVDVIGTYTPDSCTSGTVDIRISSNAFHDQGGPSVNDPVFAQVFFYGANTCNFTQFGWSYSGVVQFSTKDSNGAGIPRSATGSGQLTSDDGTDMIAFNFAVNAVGVSYQDKKNEHLVITFGTQTIVIDEKYDASANSNATGTLNVSTQTLGTLNFASVTATLQDYRNHVLTITK